MGGLDVVQPRLLVGGDLVHVDTVDVALYAREEDHHLETNASRKTERNTKYATREKPTIRT